MGGVPQSLQNKFPKYILYAKNVTGIGAKFKKKVLHNMSTPPNTILLDTLKEQRSLPQGRYCCYGNSTAQ